MASRPAEAPAWGHILAAANSRLTAPDTSAQIFLCGADFHNFRPLKVSEADAAQCSRRDVIYCRICRPVTIIQALQHLAESLKFADFLPISALCCVYAQSVSSWKAGAFQAALLRGRPGLRAETVARSRGGIHKNQVLVSYGISLAIFAACTPERLQSRRFRTS